MVWLFGAQSLRTAQVNIKSARDEVEEMLGHLDTARQVSIPMLLHSQEAKFTVWQQFLRPCL